MRENTNLKGSDSSCPSIYFLLYGDVPAGYSSSDDENHLQYLQYSRLIILFHYFLKSTAHLGITQKLLRMIRRHASLVLWAVISQNLAHQLVRNAPWYIVLGKKGLMTSLNAKVRTVLSKSY